MKGIFSFFEKAGLVKSDELTAQQVLPAQAVMGVVPGADSASKPSAVKSPAARIVQDDGLPLDLDQIYAREGVPASVYPAERLLRLVDGLSAMDEATRQMAIRAMDAADESWTIENPLADAAAKVVALAAHASQLEAGLGLLEDETKLKLEAINKRQEQAIGSIRKQIVDLEALAAREAARASEEAASHESSLNLLKAQTVGSLEKINQVIDRFQGLVTQFTAPLTLFAAVKEKE